MRCSEIGMEGHKGLIAEIAENCRRVRGVQLECGSEPNARLLGRKERDPSRGSPGFLSGQRTLVRNDNAN